MGYSGKLLQLKPVNASFRASGVLRGMSRGMECSGLLCLQSMCHGVARCCFAHASSRWAPSQKEGTFVQTNGEFEARKETVNKILSQRGCMV